MSELFLLKKPKNSDIVLNTARFKPLKYNILNNKNSYMYTVLSQIYIYI